MPIANYGLLKGTVIGHERDADDDHYQVLGRAGRTLHRVAVNVKSSAPKSPSTLLFASATSLPSAFTEALRKQPAGFQKLAPRPGGLALDFLRSGIVKTKSMKPLPPDVPGADNDLKDAIEAAALRALALPGSMLYALGAKWGPEPKTKDRYFGFLPGNGVHDVHMNQGNGGKYRKDNGVYQDGALIFEYPAAGATTVRRWKAFFLAFQSQSCDTDGQGNPR